MTGQTSYYDLFLLVLTGNCANVREGFFAFGFFESLGLERCSLIVDLVTVAILAQGKQSG